jgi:hypothetical protein
MKQERLLKPFEQIVVENIAQSNLKLFMQIMAFEGNLQLLIHHNRMVYRREKIEPSLIW